MVIVQGQDKVGRLTLRRRVSGAVDDRGGRRGFGSANRNQGEEQSWSVGGVGAKRRMEEVYIDREAQPDNRLCSPGPLSSRRKSNDHASPLNPLHALEQIRTYYRQDLTARQRDERPKIYMYA